MTTKSDWLLSQKRQGKPGPQPMKRTIFSWDACLGAHNSQKVDLRVHLLPLKSRRNRLPFSCRYCLLPAACTKVCSTCWLCGSHKRPGSQRKSPIAMVNTKATLQLFVYKDSVCVGRVSESMRVRLEFVLTIPSKPTLYRFFAPLSHST